MKIGELSFQPVGLMKFPQQYENVNILKIYPKNSKILLVGPYPPPLGGVSVHIKRLKKLKGIDAKSTEIPIHFRISAT